MRPLLFTIAFLTWCSGSVPAQSQNPITISQGLVINSYYPNRLVKRVDNWFASNYEKGTYQFNANLDMGMITATVTVPFESEYNDEECFASGTLTYKVAIYLSSNKVVYAFTNFFHEADTSLFVAPEMDEEEKEEFVPPEPISFGVISYEEDCPFETMASGRWNDKVWEELQLTIKREFKRRSFSLSRVLLNM